LGEFRINQSPYPHITATAGICREWIKMDVSQTEPDPLWGWKMLYALSAILGTLTVTAAGLEVFFTESSSRRPTNPATDMLMFSLAETVVTVLLGLNIHRDSRALNPGRSPWPLASPAIICRFGCVMFALTALLAMLVKTDGRHGVISFIVVGSFIGFVGCLLALILGLHRPSPSGGEPRPTGPVSF
jgi:hypothetical protein